jgi:protease-4
MQATYDRFVDLVARGRGRPVVEVEPSCRGRVWTGSDAAQIGLIDATGDLNAAIAAAGELAGLKRWSRIDLEVDPEPLWRELGRRFLLRRLPVARLVTDAWDGGLWSLAASLRRGEALALLPWWQELD